jgi:hypothetical protein
MHQQSFLHRSWIKVENRPLCRRDFHETIGYRLRGVWRYAQDTVPIRACLFSIIKGLLVSPAVDGLSTGREKLKIFNKNSGWVLQ